MLRVSLAFASLLLILPFAPLAAADDFPVDWPNCTLLPRPEVCYQARTIVMTQWRTLDPVAQDTQSTLATTDDAAEAALDALETAPTSFAVAAGHAMTCGFQTDLACVGLAGGIPVGEDDLCAGSPQGSGATLAAWAIVRTTSAVVRSAGYEYGEGTLLWGESLCHDHWATASAAAVQLDAVLP